MKQLFIIRHAKSSWKQAGVTDFDRTLNKRGLHDAKDMGKRLCDRGIVPELIFHSSAIRAAMTAELIAEEVRVGKERLISQQELYLAGPTALLGFVHSLPTDANSVFLIGHNPGLTYLANLLAGNVVTDMPTCAVAALSFDLADWVNISHGSGQLDFFDTPKTEH